LGEMALPILLTLLAWGKVAFTYFLLLVPLAGILAIARRTRIAAVICLAAVALVCVFDALLLASMMLAIYGDTIWGGIAVMTAGATVILIGALLGVLHGDWRAVIDLGVLSAVMFSAGVVGAVLFGTIEMDEGGD
jgi:hypothetical protein